jgi:ribosome maturation factor RimP
MIPGAVTAIGRKGTGMERSEQITQMIAPTLESMGYEVVRVRHLGSQRATLQVMAERVDGIPISVDDCARISRAVSVLLDVEDPIPGAYTLEVSSPGIDRPLVRKKDFESYAGFEARVEMRQPIDGRRRFRGRLLGVQGDCLRIAFDDEEATLPLSEVEEARLVLTEELVAAVQQGKKRN